MHTCAQYGVILANYTVSEILSYRYTVSEIDNFLLLISIDIVPIIVCRQL
jgi:hypothetical protein